MNAFYRCICIADVTIHCCHQAAAQPAVISSTSMNGQLTVQAPVGSDLNVEWSSDLNPGSPWTDRWDSLLGIHCTNTTMQASVPMFYRVVCFTNGLLWPLKPGIAVFTVSNALGETATQQVRILGLSYYPEFTNYYAVVCVSDAALTGGKPSGTYLTRSDDQCVWTIYDPLSHSEGQELFKGTVGTVITNAENVRIAIEAIETVAVPAGVFTNCFKFHKTQLSANNPNPDWYEWISPGNGMVKWVGYYGGGSGMPVVYQLQSCSKL